MSDAVAARVREARKRRYWQVADLAARCAERGYPELTGNVIENIEHGRRRGGKRTRAVTIDELLALAYALDVTPLYLICGLDDMAEIAVTPQLAVRAIQARNWIQGFETLPGMNEEDYVESLPVSMRGGYARNADEALAAVDGLREDLLRRLAAADSLRADLEQEHEGRRKLQERMRSLSEQAMRPETES